MHRARGPGEEGGANKKDSDSGNEDPTASEDDEDLILFVDQKNAKESPKLAYVVELKDDSIFTLGETFSSYEELRLRLEKHSKKSLVHYYRRDSRTVGRAHVKTNRPIEKKLVYYSIKFTCVYGGQKFSPKGRGFRNSLTLKTNCPAHILVRANKSGQQLEVISVCNRHNHDISLDLYRKLPQDRKLSKPLRTDVLDLLKMGTDKKKVKDYIRSKTGKYLTDKDLINLLAGPRTNDKKIVKEKNPPRKKEQIEILEEVEMEPSESQESVDWVVVDTAEQEYEESEKNINILTEDNAMFSGDLNHLCDNSMGTIGGEVEIFYNETANDSNMIEYLPSYSDICQSSSGDKNEENFQCETITIDDSELTRSSEVSEEVEQPENVVYVKMLDETGKVFNPEAPETFVINDDEDENVFILGDSDSPFRMVKLEESGKYILRDSREDELDESLPILQNVMFAQQGEAVPSELSEVLKLRKETCSSCGRDAKAAEKYIALLKEQKDRLLVETMALTAMRDRLRIDIELEKVNLERIHSFNR